MNEKSNHHEKDSSTDDDEQTTTDSSKSDSDTGRTEKQESSQGLTQDKEKQTTKDSLASFFKTKAEREQDATRKPEHKVDSEPVEESDKDQQKPEDIEHLETTDEGEITSENLTNEEVQEATLAIVDARTQEVSEELQTTEPDSADEFEAIADAVFLESLQDLASNEIEITPEVIDAAFNEALEDLSIGDEIEESEEILADDVEPEEATVVILDEDENVATVSPAAPPIISLSTPLVAPPMPPVGPSTPPVGSNGPTFGSGHNYTPANNLNVGQNNKNTPAPVIIEEINNYHSDLLLGVILGYIIGRRGGRKRTEKKLIPKIDNLENQVKILHDTIVEKEVKIRRIARENAEMIQRSPNNAVIVLERRKTKKQVKETLKRRELLAQDPGVEKIGKFSLPALKVFHERRLPDGTENSPERKRVEVMTENELLEKAKPIVVHDLYVIEMYQRRRLTLESLRQITKEYLRNGPYEQTFLRELLPDPEIIEQKRDQIANTESTINHQNMREIYSNQPDFSNANIVNNADKTYTAPKSQKTAKSMTKKMAISGVITGIFVAAIIAVVLMVR